MCEKMFFVHTTAEVSPEATVGAGSAIWNQVQIRENASIGKHVILSKNVYIDAGVSIGSNCKVQNNVSIYNGVTLQDGVFVGPHVCFTNDRYPRAITVDGELKGSEDWTVTSTLISRGASLGAHSVILAGITIGPFAMVGAGSVVTSDVPSHALVFGNPAVLVCYVCFCGHRLHWSGGEFRCPVCDQKVANIPEGSTQLKSPVRNYGPLGRG